MKNNLLYALLCLLLLAPARIFAAEPPADSSGVNVADSLKFAVFFDSVSKSLKYQTGKIVIGDDLATLNLPSTLRYLDPEQTNTVLTMLWGNPPSETKYLGMLLPSDVDPNSRESWGVVLDYVDDGHMKDDEADDIDYDDLLEEMQEAVKGNNEERLKAGYGAMELVGWGEKPFYDKTNHILHWAKELKNEGHDENTLNYNIRVLGRTGVLELNLVCGMKQYTNGLKGRMQELLAVPAFNKGKTYADFDESADKVAAYGLGALVAGGALAKVGFFKGIFLALLAAKKFVIMGVLAIGAFIYRLFTGKKKDEEENPSA